MLSAYLSCFHINVEIVPQSLRESTVELHKIAVIKKQLEKFFSKKNLIFPKYRKA